MTANDRTYSLFMSLSIENPGRTAMLLKRKKQTYLFGQVILSHRH